MMWRGQMEHSTSLLPALQELPIQYQTHTKAPVSFKEDLDMSITVIIFPQLLFLPVLFIGDTNGDKDDV